MIAAQGELPSAYSWGKAGSANFAFAVFSHLTSAREVMELASTPALRPILQERHYHVLGADAYIHHAY